MKYLFTELVFLPKFYFLVVTFQPETLES